MPLAPASPTVLQISFAFMYLQKRLKNIYPMVWHLDFANLLTWQKEGKDWRIEACSHLALGNWREVRARLRVEVARVWQHLAARLFYELPIGLPSTPGTPLMLSQLFVFFLSVFYQRQVLYRCPLDRFYRERLQPPNFERLCTNAATSAPRR